MQKEARKKVAVNAISSIPDFDGTTKYWKKWSKLFIDYMTQVGYGIVCNEDYLELAQSAGWNEAKIMEASTYVWFQLRAATFKHIDAANQLTLAGPSNDGYMCWQGLSTKHGILGYSRAEELRVELRDFAPISGDTPITAMDRFAISLHEYEELEGVDPWREDDKIRKLLDILEQWDDELSNQTDAIRRELVLKKEVKTLDDICGEVRAYWSSFGARKSKLKLHAMKLKTQAQEDSRLDSITSQLDKLTSSVLVLTGATNSGSRTPGDSSTSTGRQKRTPAEIAESQKVVEKECGSATCKVVFKGKNWMTLCKECFTEAKDTKSPVPLSDGRTLQVASRTERDSRGRTGGIKVTIATMRMVTMQSLYDTLEPDFHQDLMNEVCAGAPSSFQPEHTLLPTKSSVLSTNLTKQSFRPTGKPIFVVADSGGGGSASGEPRLFHKHGFPVNAEIEGYKSGQDSLVRASHASVMIMLVKDRRTHQPLVLKAGGTLECEAGTTTATVLSGGQTSNFWLATEGKHGAQMDTRNHRTCHLMLPDGHEVQMYQKGGQFGFDAWTVAEDTAAYNNAKHIWIAKDEIHRPPARKDVPPDPVTPYRVRLFASCPVEMVIGQVFSSVNKQGVVVEDFLVTNLGHDPSVAVVVEPTTAREHPGSRTVRRVVPVELAATWITEFAPHGEILELPVWEAPDQTPTEIPGRDPTLVVAGNVKGLPETVLDQEVGDRGSVLHRQAEALVSTPALGKYTYLEPLTEDPEDQSIGLKRFAAHSAKKVAATLDLSHGGGEIFTSKGRAALTAKNTRFVAPAAKGRQHKLKKNSKLDKAREKFRPKPGKVLTGDIYYSLLGKRLGNYVQLLVDLVVPYGDCFFIQSKSSRDMLPVIQEHIANVGRPEVYLGDGDPTQQKGQVRDWLLSKGVQVRSSTPHRQGQNYGAEGYARKWSTAVTFIMLDSQLPKKFTKYAGKSACVILSIMAIELDGRMTTAFYEFHGVKFDVRLLKRVGCEVFFLLEKKDRVKFGVKGRRGVLLGFPLHTGPEWTYWVYDFLSGVVLQRRDVLFNERSMPFVDARMKFTSVTGKPHFATRGVGNFQRSMLRDHDEDYNLDGWDVGQHAQDICHDTLNDFLPQHDPILSPVKKGDTLFVGATPTTVTSVQLGEITVRDLLSDALITVPTEVNLYVDEVGLLTRERTSTRNRMTRTFFTPDDSKARITKQAAARVRRGEDLVGERFVDSIIPGGSPVEFVVTNTCRFDSKPALEYKAVVTPNFGPKTFISTVPEVRSWVDTLAPSPFFVNSELQELLQPEGEEATLHHSGKGGESMINNVDGNTESTINNVDENADIQVSQVDAPVPILRTARLLVEKDCRVWRSLSVEDLKDSEAESTEILKPEDIILTPEDAPERVLTETLKPEDITLKPGDAPESVLESLRRHIHVCKLSRKPKKIPRRVVVQVLLGNVKTAYFKYGVRVPGSRKEALDPKRTKNHESWKRTMKEEVDGLTVLGAFLKGLYLSDLPNDVKPSDIISSLWVFDVKPNGTERSRLVARGDMQNGDYDHDKFSPVVQLQTVRVVLAVAAQLNLELVFLDLPKAFLLGRMDLTKPVYMYAPEGFGEPGEIYQLLLPIYGLTISSRRFFETLSEFLRAIGYEHFPGHDNCLFRRVRTLPTAEEANTLASEALAIGLKPRPKITITADGTPIGPIPRGPATLSPTLDADGQPIRPSHMYSYPEYMDLPEFQANPTVAFEPHAAEGLGPDVNFALPWGTYPEMACAYVDDILGATHHSAQMAKEFIRRFGAKTDPMGSLYLGMDLIQDLEKGYIFLGFKTYLGRIAERLKSKEEPELRTVTGWLLWLTNNLFATHLVEVKDLLRRVNKPTTEDYKLALTVLYELLGRKEQGIYYRQRGEGLHIFHPRSTRIEGIEDVSVQTNFKQLETKEQKVKAGEVVVSPEDILAADNDIDVYLPDRDDPSPEAEVIPVDANFGLDNYSDGSYAPAGDSRRSILGAMVRINGGPVTWTSNKMDGIAGSSFEAEYCASSVATKKSISVLNLMNFMGINPKEEVQYCDSTSVKMIALNPNSLGAARSLGIRMHTTRYAIAKRGLDLRYCITQDQISDFLTKRMPRKALARLAAIFFNCLADDWRNDWETLTLVVPLEHFPELTNDLGAAESKLSKFTTAHKTGPAESNDDIEEEEDDVVDGVDFTEVNDTSLAQQAWMITYMQDSNNQWPLNALRMLHLLGTPQYSNQYAQATPIQRRALLRFYANTGHRIALPPLDLNRLVKDMDTPSRPPPTYENVMNLHHQRTCGRMAEHGAPHTPRDVSVIDTQGSSSTENEMGESDSESQGSSSTKNETTSSRESRRYQLQQPLNTQDKETDPFDFSLWSDLVNHDWDDDANEFEYDERNLGPD